MVTTVREWRDFDESHLPNSYLFFLKGALSYDVCTAILNNPIRSHLKGIIFCALLEITSRIWLMTGVMIFNKLTVLILTQTNCSIIDALKLHFSLFILFSLCQSQAHLQMSLLTPHFFPFLGFTLFHFLCVSIVHFLIFHSRSNRADCCYVACLCICV